MRLIVLHHFHMLEDGRGEDACLSRNRPTDHEHYSELSHRMRETEHDGTDISSQCNRGYDRQKRIPL